MEGKLLITTDPDLTTIRVREVGSPSWVEFRSSLPYHLWTECPSHAAMLHDTLEGWHACVLHAGSDLVLLPKHPDYARVKAFVEMMDKARFPFYRDGRVVEG